MIKLKFAKGDPLGKDRAFLNAEETFEKYLRSRSALCEAIRKEQPQWSDGRRHVLQSRDGLRTIVMVMVDTGADIYCMPASLTDAMGPMCRRIKGSVQCGGVGGTTLTGMACYPTPFGFRDGLVNTVLPQSLMPGSEFARNGYLHHSDDAAVVSYRGVLTSICNILGQFVYAPFLYQAGSVVLLNDDEWHKFLEPLNHIDAPQDPDRHVVFRSSSISAIGQLPGLQIKTNNNDFANETAARREVRCINLNDKTSTSFCRSTHICSDGDCGHPQCYKFQCLTLSSCMSAPRTRDDFKDSNVTVANADGDQNSSTEGDLVATAYVGKKATPGPGDTGSMEDSIGVSDGTEMKSKCKVTFEEAIVVQRFSRLQPAANLNSFYGPGWTRESVAIGEIQGPLNMRPVRVLAARARAPT